MYIAYDDNVTIILRLKPRNSDIFLTRSISIDNLYILEPAIPRSLYFPPIFSNFPARLSEKKITKDASFGEEIFQAEPVSERSEVRRRGLCHQRDE